MMTAAGRCAREGERHGCTLEGGDGKLVVYSGVLGVSNGGPGYKQWESRVLTIGVLGVSNESLECKE